MSLEADPSSGRFGAAANAERVPCTLPQFLGSFARLGTLGFGGPIALAGYMQRDLVEERRWISKQVARSAYKLVRLTLKQDRLLWIVFAVSAIVTASTETEIVWLFVLSGVVVLVARRPPRRASVVLL